VDEHLKLLAEAGLALSEAEESIDADERGAAAGALDRADEHLAALRERWGGMRSAEPAIVGPAAAPLRERLDRGRQQVRPRAALSQGSPERDPEQDVDPAAEAA
jgi:hypothetical protein